ncbi:MAG: serine/threonine-protein kinase [Planctomycetaceae bacterium]
MIRPYVESLILEFERAWLVYEPRPIIEFLERGADSKTEQRALLFELIAIDLEFRWQNRSGDGSRFERRILDDYAAEFFELEDPPIELIGEEYRVRCRAGERDQARSSLLRRYASRAPSVGKLLDRVDAEMRAEQADPRMRLETAQTSPVDLSHRFAAKGECAVLDWGDYLLVKRIGAGRTGRVYRAWQRSIERTVAVKFLRKLFWHDERTVARFLNEAQVAGSSAHPGILPLHGVGQTSAGAFFIAMELAAGGSLQDAMRARPVSIDEGVRWTIEGCNAIEHMHRQGIIHCDLKPGNLLLAEDGRVLVADFGLACSAIDAVSADREIAGTAPFMAPEQVSSHWGTISPRTDIYGLGAVLYSLLTGVTPHTGRNAAEILARVASGIAIVPPRAIRPDLPADLNDICVRSLAKVPEDRFESVQQLADAIARSRGNSE